MKKTILHIVGARPNFMKVAPVMTALENTNVFRQVLVHSGQHYDDNMSRIFFSDLELPEPDINLEVGSDTHTRQTAQIMQRLEPVLVDHSPDLVLVYGDVNSTVAAALTCTKMRIPVGHVEAGLRSFDRTMPEEINRLLTDQVADLLFTPSIDGDRNLLREGVAEDKIHRVGNVMIDTLVRLLPKTDSHWENLRRQLDIEERCFGLITLHRPSNVDDPAMLKNILNSLETIGRKFLLIFPVHPRTKQQMLKMEVVLGRRLNLIDPLGYLDFLALQRQAAFVITDSGGIQEETTYLLVPCLTIRENTERPVTVSQGTNILVGQNMQRLVAETEKILHGVSKPGEIPPLWDGRAGKRIADIVHRTLCG